MQRLQHTDALHRRGWPDSVMNDEFMSSYFVRTVAAPRSFLTQLVFVE